MAKEDTIEIEGKVLEIIPGGKFKVQLENGPDVNNVMYGTLVGGDTEMIQIGESNWEGQASVYVGYNDNSIYYLSQLYLVEQ